MSFEKISLKTIVNEAVKKVSVMAKRKDIKINSEEVRDLPLEGDERSLIELFVIFLDNAIKYSPNKSLIGLKAKKLDHTIRIEIKDNGLGIEQNDLPFIFDRFYRVEQSRSGEKVVGFGLGLSIAKKIVEEHGGSVTATSITGKGTTFTINLPIGR